MRVLVLGAAGMLGHRVLRELADRGHSMTATIRETAAPAGTTNALSRAAALETFDAQSSSPGVLLDSIQPEAVVNAIGIVKQRALASEPIPSIEVNALFPHRLAEACRARRIYLVHVSTDCVFSGRKGHYTENDIPDPVDLYGRTKLVGEVGGPGCVTLRTSMVGWELRTRSGLLEWFAGRRGQTVSGFRKAVFSGLSTPELARVIAMVLEREKESRLQGLWHVGGAPISKHDLLLALREALRWSDVAIRPSDDVVCDRSLESERFRGVASWTPPTWDAMIDELAREWPAYAAGRESQ